MDIKEITHEIMFGGLSNQDLESVVSAVQFARSQLSKNTKRSLSVGNTVTFRSPRLGSHTGRVEKIAIKYITIRTPQGLYKVPANMVEVV
jgi:hypothetical protein